LIVVAFGSITAAELIFRSAGKVSSTGKAKGDKASCPRGCVMLRGKRENRAGKQLGI
jgi:hypothetical protein